LWLRHQKRKISSKNDELYIKLSKNNLIKYNLDEYLTDKDLNKDKDKLSLDEGYKLILEYIKENGYVPTYQIKYKNKHIGNWLHNQKRKINSQTDELYIKLSENKLIKTKLDDYLIKKNNKKYNTIIKNKKEILSTDSHKEDNFMNLSKRQLDVTPKEIHTIQTIRNNKILEPNKIIIVKPKINKLINKDIFDE